ncbi:MAG TPA: PAS-domain containing protein [Lysobacter sp.]|jgi:PAS domain S-box-containing protein|nr:PAS-domain containing protein [Lysobacter sp.]
MQDSVDPAKLHDPRRQELLQAGLDLLEQGFTVFDADLGLVAWNRAFLDLLDFPDRLAFVGAPFESFMRYNAERGEYGPGDVEELVAHRVRLARAFTPHYAERDRPNGSIMAVRGEPLPNNGFVTTYTDITARRHYERLIQEQNAELERRVAQRTAELESSNRQLVAASEANQQVTAALRRSEERLRLITDAVPALIAYFDRDEVYGYVNKGYAEWFGCSKDTVVGKRIREVAGDDVYGAIAHHVARSLDGHRVSYEYSMRRSDGKVLHARSELVPEVDSDGVVLGCFVLSVDITELKDAQAALVNAQKMEAVGQLTGGLAHDFNNMLTVVIGNLASLRERHPDAVEIEEFVVPAISAAQRGAVLIKRLLTFTRQQPIEARPVDIRAMVSDTMVLLKRTLPENIDIASTSSAEPLHALTDPHQLENALLNLALNARDAMPDGGQLRIEASTLELTAEQALQFEVEPGRYMALSVADTGTGMDPVTLARAFEPFFTTKRFGSGSGLGLSMVYGFVKQSGGGIRIESPIGSGCTVTLVLPSCKAGEEAQPPLPRPRAVGSDGSDRPLVLLVEDDPGVRRVVRLQLVELGYPVIEAANGVDALNILNTVASVGVLISDIVMPAGIDGRTLCRQAREGHPQIRILLISGYVANAEEPVALNENGPPLLRKPFTVAELQAAIESLGP